MGVQRDAPEMCSKACIPTLLKAEFQCLLYHHGSGWVEENLLCAVSFYRNAYIYYEQQEEGQIWKNSKGCILLWLVDIM